VSGDAPQVLFVTKPLAPPWDDSGKVLPYLLAREIRDIRLGVMVPRGQPLAVPGVRSEEIYRRAWSYTVPLRDKLKLMFRLVFRAVPPVVHFFFSPNGPTTAAARWVRRRHPGVKVVQTVMSLPLGGEALDHGIFGDVVVTWSRSAAARVQEVVNRRGLPVRVVHVPPGVEERRPMTAAERRATRSSFGLPPDRPVVLYAGDLEFSTAAFTTAAAIPGVLDHVPAVFVFACRPKTAAARGVQADLEARLADHAARGTVRFMGAVKAFGDLLRCVDVQVLPAETTYAKTDLPLVLLEGLTAGVPAVVGTGTPMDELVEAGAAIGVPPGSPEALASALSGLLGGAGRAEALGAAGREIALRRHSARVMADAHADLYRDLLGGR
jgi:glycosyltransferase involved in cell wall biosynthesis